MKKIILLVVLLSIFALTFRTTAKAECDKTCLEGQISEYRQKVTQLQTQANTLSNQVAQFNAQIALSQLKIEQTQEQIELLSSRIDQVQGSLDNLQKAFSARAVATYKMARTNEPAYLVLSADDLTDAISKYHYLKEAEDSDRELLGRLQSAQDSYEDSKKKSEELEKELQSEQVVLNSQKAAKTQLLVSTQNDEKKYQQLLVQAQTQLSAFRSFVTNQGGASILNNQTVCNDWGCYYNQRDSKWGNQGLGTSALSVAEYGCLISSSAMIATFYKKNLTPADIAASANAFFSSNSDTALMWRDINVNGVRIIRNSISPTTSSIDSELAAGRPVIVGVYNGPAHFVVIKSGSNGNYIMNDPFMEGGNDVSFTSKYSLSSITDVESVSIQ